MTTTSRLDILTWVDLAELHRQLADTLHHYRHVLPKDPKGSIVIKPNLNSNMNALTGNTTDLRLLAAVIRALQAMGYTNITIAEGTNSGFYRYGISVIARLKVDRLADHLGVACIDLNQSQALPIAFADGLSAGVAREVLEADCLINMPKLKTHFEMGMSVCLKNLIGCLVGQENKKKTHQSLARNILHLTEQIAPHLHIVDALFAMEGLGPTKGTPVKTDTVLIGTNPYLIDLVAARFAQVDYRTVATLALAEQLGFIDAESKRQAAELPLALAPQSFAPPRAGALATFIHHPRRQKYFLAIRNTPFFNWLCSTTLAGRLLYLLDLRQDVFIDEEMTLEGLSFSASTCTACGRCRQYCPVELALPEALVDDNPAGCISCLYCFCVCPVQAIGIKGELGFMAEQLKQYDTIIRTIA